MKLPINQLLYLAIVGLLGGSAWQFYETYRELHAPQDQEQVNETFSQLIDRGRSQKRDFKGPNYAAKEPWESFKAANFTGKEPPPPVVEQPPEVERPPPEKVKTPLEDICEIMCLVYEGDSSRAVVRYLETSGVVPPDGLEPATPAAVMPPQAPNRPRRPNQPPPMPTAGAPQEGYVHFLDLEGALWEPFSHIKLVRVDDRAKYAEFVRQDGEQEGEPERLYKDELELGQAVLEALDRIQRSGEGVASGEVRPDVEQPVAPSRAWQGGEQTQRVGSDYHIGTVDWQVWSDDPNRIVNEEIGTASYSRNGVSGVQITKVSPRMQEFGVVEGDVVIAVNGRSVSSKSQAIKVGKDLYKRGTRTFDVTILSRGREVTRTYVAPEGGR